ncbi:MAG: S41 family peptidase [Gammaproteobacteria bacterium]|nr:S41 family peptidase [Gammaproteobacteria bacterium]
MLLPRLGLLTAAALIVGCGGGSGDVNFQPSVRAIGSQTLAAGETLSVQAQVTDGNPEDGHRLTATSSDSAVASVTVEGTVLAVNGVAPGTATITVTARDTSGEANAESLPVRFDVTVTGGWVAGRFEPASQFKDLCANPRAPSGGEGFPDLPGEAVDENNWLRSWSNDTYLWYDEITDRDPALHATPTYFDLLRTFEKTPSGNDKDRFHFTYPTAQWKALSESGVALGYGARIVLLSRRPPREAAVAFVEPASPASRAGMGRGTRILEIDGADLVNGGTQADVDTLNAGLFPAAEGESHEFVIQDLGADAPRTVTLQAAAVAADPVQHVQVLGTDQGPVGYMLFNDFIATAERELIGAVEELAAAGIVDLVLDLRYNGGGYLDIASQLGFMIAGPSAAQGRTFEAIEFNDKHQQFDPVTGRVLEPLLFHDTSLGFSGPANEPLPSLNLPRVFMLTGVGTCSASESVMNSLRGIDVEVVQIGSATCGKPYGFYATDNCGTTYFTIQFRGVNDKGFGDYADGFFPSNDPGSDGAALPGCAIADDFDHGFGDPNEARLAAALHYRERSACPCPDCAPAAAAKRQADGIPLAPQGMHGLKIASPGR